MESKQLEELLAGILKEELDKEISKRVEIIMSQLDKNDLLRAGAINHKFINFDGVQLTGHNIKGGIIKDFNSTGIQDKARGCQLTIDDNYTIIENKLLTTDAELRGNLIVDGNIVLKGNMKIGDMPIGQLKEFVAAQITEQVNKIDLVPLITSHIVKLFQDPGRHNLLNEGSLSHQYINFTGMKFTGDSIEGGIIKEFNSTGIQDLATDCQVTISDENTIIENMLVANDMDIKGRLTVGTEILLGDSAKSKLSSIMLEKFLAEKKDDLVKSVGDDLQTRKLDLSNLQVDGEPLVAERMLSRSILKSNLQELGELKELKVKGESLFADSIYITKGRVGINTTKPTAALTVWDQEAEIVIKKAYKNTGFIGTERTTNVVLGANNKNNLVLGADGTVNVDDINIASIKVSVGDKEPGHKGNVGDIIFNSNPNNIPVTGWQCLGGTRWKRF